MMTSPGRQGGAEEVILSRIRLLSDSLIDRIAAGEVVERPASIVKELVENSLDAGARTIHVLLRGGGKARIEVRDDGVGMGREDAQMALERHATSKLRDLSDLDAIGTLGFRGEALSSIAAVSELTLSTATKSGEGTQVEVHGGRIQGVSEVAHPAGTTIRVDRLFYNVPARRKFLRSDPTEVAHAVRWLTRYSLAHPERGFHLQHGDRQLLDTEPAEDRTRRLAQIYGRERVDRLLPVESSVAGLSITGYTSRPVDSLPRRDAQHVFINGRSIQDRLLSHAVIQAYENTMARGRYPSLFLFIEIDPSAVDVNVHPQKTEVRFREPSRVHDAVRDTLLRALSAERAIPSLDELRPPSTDYREGVREATVAYLAKQQAVGLSPRTDGGRAGAAPVEPALAVGQATPLAQYRDSYIVAQDRDGLVLVDQHAAHERVLFEQLLDHAEADQVEVQSLMFPVTIELSAEEALLVEAETEEFHRLGFRIEPFGERATRLSGVPALAAGDDPEGLFRELLGEAGQARSAARDVRVLRRRLVTTAACHAAIKVNHPLTLSAMRGLLEDLYATRNPTTCPHGRPALFRLTTEEIERAFRRR